MKLIVQKTVALSVFGAAVVFSIASGGGISVDGGFADDGRLDQDDGGRLDQDDGGS